MQTRRLGRSGLQVGRIGLGTLTWGGRTGPDEVAELYRAFRDAGGTLLDTSAATPAAESLLGQQLASERRGEVVVLAKSGVREVNGALRVDVSARGLLDDLDETLGRLGTDHVDVWMPQAYDAAVPATEVASALLTGWRQGKARYVGVANYPAWASAYLCAELRAQGADLVAVSTEYSLAARSGGAATLAAGEAIGFSVLPWAPLGRGVLGGRYGAKTPADSRLASDELADYAGKHVGPHTSGLMDAVRTAATGLGVTPAVVALAWVRDRPGVAAPIVGPRTVAQWRDLASAEELELPAEIAAALAEVSAAR